MSERVQISYSFEMGTSSRGDPPRQQATSSNMIAYTAVEAVQMSERHILVMDQHGDGRQLLTPEVAVALEEHCTRFRTLERHAETVVAKTPQLAGQLENVKQVLHQVEQAGLFKRAEDICRDWRSDHSADGEAELPVRVFIITCDRPAAVERLLESILDTPGLSACQQLILIDDSRKQQNANANRLLMETFQSKSPVSAKYVGDEEIRGLVQHLAENIPRARSAVEFLLDRKRWGKHKTYGLSRNVALLLSVGCRTIVFDDDAICRGVPSPRSESRVSVSSEAREMDLFPSLEAVEEEIAAAEDPISAQIAVLGRQQASAVEVLQKRPLTGEDLAGVDYRFLGRLNPRDPVLVCECGSIGDPGTGSHHFLHRLSEASVSRALATPGGLQAVFDTRFIRLGRDRPTFTPQAMMSAMTGLDNSRLLPPYMPAFRGEDFLFGGMLLHLYPYSAVLDLNLAVPHLPIEDRVGTRTVSGVAAAGGISTLGTYIRDSVSWTRGPTPLTRLNRLSQTLCELAESKDSELLNRYRREMANENANQLLCLDEALNSAPADSEEWQRYLQQGRQEVIMAIQASKSPVDVSGVPETMSESELLHRTKTYLREFAEVLVMWPEIREVAADYEI